MLRSAGRATLAAGRAGEGGAIDPVVLEDEDRVRAAAAAIGEGLNAFNDAVTGVSDRRPLAVVVTDPDTGAVLGGVAGRSSLGLLFLDVFHLPERLRGQGLGRRVLAAAEAEGRRRGCRSAVLFTISFQAPGFYQRHGWRVLGEVPCDPPGTSRVVMTKALRGKGEAPRDAG